MHHTYYDVENWATANLMYCGSRNNVQTWMLSSIEVNQKFRGNGVASRLLKRATDAADKEGTVLILGVQPDGTGLGYDALQAWYERNGFVMNEDEAYMIREPRR
jgi:ribosomal protein S18 acetylase RimI-like enzyme